MEGLKYFPKSIKIWICFRLKLLLSFSHENEYQHSSLCLAMDTLIPYQNIFMTFSLTSYLTKKSAVVLFDKVVSGNVYEWTILWSNMLFYLVHPSICLLLTLIVIEMFMHVCLTLANQKKNFTVYLTQLTWLCWYQQYILAKNLFNLLIIFMKEGLVFAFVMGVG